MLAARELGRKLAGKRDQTELTDLTDPSSVPKIARSDKPKNPDGGPLDDSKLEIVRVYEILQPNEFHPRMFDKRNPYSLTSMDEEHKDAPILGLSKGLLEGLPLGKDKVVSEEDGDLELHYWVMFEGAWMIIKVTLLLEKDKETGVDSTEYCMLTFNQHLLSEYNKTRKDLIQVSIKDSLLLEYAKFWGKSNSDMTETDIEKATHWLGISEGKEVQFSNGKNYTVRPAKIYLDSFYFFQKADKDEVDAWLAYGFDPAKMLKARKFDLQKYLRKKRGFKFLRFLQFNQAVSDIAKLGKKMSWIFSIPPLKIEDSFKFDSIWSRIITPVTLDDVSFSMKKKSTISATLTSADTITSDIAKKLVRGMLEPNNPYYLRSWAEGRGFDSLSPLDLKLSGRGAQKQPFVWPYKSASTSLKEYANRYIPNLPVEPEAATLWTATPSTNSMSAAKKKLITTDYYDQFDIAPVDGDGMYISARVGGMYGLMGAGNANSGFVSTTGTAAAVK